jgi:Flp pilus assembly protein TadG
VRRFGRRHYRQNGAEIVEFLVTLPVIMLVMAILIDLGSMFSDQIVLTNAARAAAREVINGASDAEAQTASDRVTGALIGYNAASPPSVVVSKADSNPGTPVTVTVNHTYTFRLLPSFIAQAATFDLAATVRMRMLPT